MLTGRWRCLHLLPPETAHGLALLGARAAAWRRRVSRRPRPRLATVVLRVRAAAPARASPPASTRTPRRCPACSGSASAFVEIGTVTPRPQAGNPRPRLFRLRRAAGADQPHGLQQRRARGGARAARGARIRAPGPARRQHRRQPRQRRPGRRLRRPACAALYPLVDYVAVNVSSPNTPGLRELQGASAAATSCSRALLEARAALAGGGRPKPLLVKIAPDLAAAGRGGHRRGRARARHRRPDHRQHHDRRGRRRDRPPSRPRRAGSAARRCSCARPRSSLRFYRLTGGAPAADRGRRHPARRRCLRQDPRRRQRAAALHRADLPGPARGRPHPRRARPAARAGRLRAAQRCARRRCRDLTSAQAIATPPPRRPAPRPARPAAAPLVRRGSARAARSSCRSALRPPAPARRWQRPASAASTRAVASRRSPSPRLQLPLPEHAPPASETPDARENSSNRNVMKRARARKFRSAGEKVALGNNFVIAATREFWTLRRRRIARHGSRRLTAARRRGARVRARGDLGRPACRPRKTSC